MSKQVFMCPTFGIVDPRCDFSNERCPVHGKVDHAPRKEAAAPIEPKRQEWVIRRFREERDGRRFFYYVGDFRRAYGTGRTFVGFQLLTNGYEARGAYWKQEALRFADRKAAKAFLYLLKSDDAGSDWHIARIDIYRVKKRVRRERVSP